MKLDRRSIPYRVAERGLGILAILVFATVSGGSSGGPGLGLAVGLTLVVVGIGAVLGWEVAYHRRFEYVLGADTVDIESGVLSRRDREIPYERIQNVDISQNPIQRALGIAEVRLETAGGGQSEASLRFVATPEAERIQDEISEAKRGSRGEAADDAPAAPEAEALFTIGDRDLVVLGLVAADLRLLGLISLVATFASPALLQDLIPGSEFLLVAGVLALLGSLVVVWLVSGIYAVARYHGFTLTRHGDELRYERGLLQRYSGTIPLEKIQSVSIDEHALARRFGYASLRIETAGYAAGQQQGERVQSAVPIAQRERVVELARELETVGDLAFERPPKRARRRYVFRYLGVVALLVAAAWVAHQVTGHVPWWPAPALLALVTPLAAHLKWVNLGYHVGEDHVVTRRGFWTRRTVVVPYHRVQTVRRSMTVFQRRRHLASLVADTAGGGGLRRGDATALDLDADVAGELRERVRERFHTAVRRRARDRAGDGAAGS